MHETSLFEIRRLSAPELGRYVGDLVDLLCASVSEGASVGFVAPVSGEEARSYWLSVESGMAGGGVLCLGAFAADGRLVGSAQLHLESKSNGRHRAEIAKVLVHPEARRRGVARRLMAELETLARENGRTLIILDTKRGDTAEGMYSAMDYKPVGVIPNYALDGTGAFGDTIIFYKELD